MGKIGNLSFMFCYFRFVIVIILCMCFSDSPRAVLDYLSIAPILVEFPLVLPRPPGLACITCYLD